MPRALEKGQPGDAGQLLRSAMATILVQGQSADTALAQAGMSTIDVTLLGPLSAFEILGFDDVTQAETTGDLSPTYIGSFGPVTPRVLSFPEGRVRLSGEAGAGVPLRGRPRRPRRLDLRRADGDLVVAQGVPRRDQALRAPGLRAPSTTTVSAQGVELSAGARRLMLKVTKEDRSGGVTVGLFRADGKPARVTFHPAKGPAPRWNGVKLASAKLVYPGAQDFAKALAPEAGEALAAFIAVNDGIGEGRRRQAAVGDDSRPCIRRR